MKNTFNVEKLKKVRFGALFISLAITATMICFALWLANKIKEINSKSEIVVSSIDAGRALNAHYIDGGLNMDKTRIETDAGVFLVYGSISILKGQRFTFEERGNGEQKLCKYRSTECHMIVDTE